VAGEILYTLFVWPIRFILEFLFVLFNRIFNAPGPAVIFLSIVVNTLSLPIYLIADRWQKEERELQKRMKKKLDSIRSVFKGDERQMIINAYYRQTGYSPVLLLKASVGLLLQIPFFIAAYQFLSRTSMLSGVSFLFLKDLNAPDGLLKGPFPWLQSINLMPFIMTAINLVSSLIYTKGMGKRERIQLFGMALIFLVLLYNSPSGLVLYWTMNNIYSLIKNAVQAGIKKSGKALQYASVLFAGVFLYFIWSGRANVERYRLLFTALALLIAAVPFIWRLLLRLFDKPGADKEKTASGSGMDALYFSAFALIFLLLGFLNPAQVLSASVSDFETPWVFMGITFLQALSFFILIPLFIRALAPVPVRRILAAGGSVLALCGMVCYFALSASYGIMDRNFKFDDTNRLLHAFPVWISMAVPLAAVVCTAVFIVLKKEKILTAFFQLVCAALFVLGITNLVSMQKQIIQLSSLVNTANESVTNDVVFPLSKTKTNVFIVFLDRAQGSAMTNALEYMPDLRNDLDGFTFYPNTLSFGNCTVTGLPPMLGGYDYTPLSVNERKDEPLTDKVNKAITAMPRSFSEAGYRVTVTDPVIANMQSVPDISVFKDMPNVTARILSGKLTDRFRSEFPSEEKTGADSFDFDILFRFGIFRLSPPALRYGIYYKGQWWREAAFNSYGRAVAEFSSLYYLPELCFTDEGTGTLNIFMSAVTHEPGAYNAELFPQSKQVVFSEEEKKRYGSENNAEYMYTILSAMKQFVKWLNYLKQQNVYDNTRIIVVADHGGNYKSGIDTAKMEGFNPLLMVKEPGSHGTLVISRDFMTNADTPYLASGKLKEAEDAKRGMLTAVLAVSSQPLRHGPYVFNLRGTRKMKGRKVLMKESWEDWERN